MNTQDKLRFTLRIYPTPEDIIAEKSYLCPIENCGTTFQNASHLQMHITRHHRCAAPELHPVYDASDKDKQKQFFCPCPTCCYFQTPSEIANGARYFSSFRSLKQHYLKVHGERKFGCSTCEKSFATASYLRHHRLSCGQSFKCEHCSFSYGSREALLTHAKRKKHGYAKLISSRKQAKSISIGTQTTVIGTEDRVTQTVPLPNCDVHSSEADQNSSMSVVAIDQYRTTVDCSLNDGSGSGEMMYMQPQGNGTIDAAESVVVCTETQTDFSDPMYPNAINHHDPLLSYTHMYTQTSDEPGLYADLGLSTIETQTSWNDGGDGFGEYLVSTETQTNFDIESFNSGSSHSNDKIDQAVQCKYTPLPYLQRTSDASSGTEFLTAMSGTIEHTLNTTQSS
uniref:C2H2-type domain-containing protein n=1 Tax=Anopheles atroparvus TaxID=41427 RepID=A0A182JKK3_ANOAO